MSDVRFTTLTRPTDRRERGEDWRAARACDEWTAWLFFGPDHENARARRRREADAKQVCAGCRVKAECLTDILTVEGSLHAPSRFGVYGGLTAEERAAIGGHGA